ncbi:MAG TPA: peptidase M48, partial [Myxococcales bacterium]|nr:peptidase M48 [Myxococcales bacterium]
MRTPLLIALLAVASCVRNPATGKLQLDLVSESQEIDLGKQAKVEAEQQYGVYKEKPALNQY